MKISSFVTLLLSSAVYAAVAAPTPTTTTQAWPKHASSATSSGSSSLDLFDMPLKRALLESMKHDDEDSRHDALHRSLQSVVKPGNECGSELANYQHKIILEMGMSLASELLITFSGELLALFYNIILDKSEDDESFGRNGEYTDEALVHMEKIEKFWNYSNPTLEVASTPGKVVLMAVHGNDLEERSHRVELCELLKLAENTRMTCQEYADDLDDIIQRIPDKYDNPLLSLNAAAANRELFLEAYGIQIEPTIVMGDGIFQFIEESSVDAEHGHEFVLAHEFGHILQMDTKDFDGTETEAESERLEILADALSAYFMSHPLGANLALDEVGQMSLHASTFGDFVEDGSGAIHGTPGQRECATLWGGAHAKADADSETYPQPVRTLYQDFDAVYSAIMDASLPVCANVTGTVTCSSSDRASGGLAASVAGAIVAWFLL